jgi:hypothetical protein
VTSAEDLRILEQQLGRELRGVVRVAARCGCGKPCVVMTEPRLPDGTPFPTVYYLTCPKATGAIGTLEANGVMAEMQERLAQDAELADAYRRAHDAYLQDREALGHVDEIAGISAGGMPNRVKCLHVLAAHSLAVGPGVNPLGDEVVAAIGEWWKPIECVGDTCE